MKPLQRHIGNKMGWLRGIENALVFDIECYSPYCIRTQFKEYVEHAVMRCIGFYSYKTSKYYCISYKEPERIQKLFDEHEILIGFNSNNFDIPILTNKVNNFKIENKKYIDIMLKFKTEGYDTMRPKLHEPTIKEILAGRRYSLKNIAHALCLPVEKGDIDYMIFKKDEYSNKEWQEINLYTYKDILITKQLFEFIYLDESKI